MSVAHKHSMVLAPCFALFLFLLSSGAAVDEGQAGLHQSLRGISETRTKRNADGYSTAEKEAIVRAHNDFRHSVDPRASYMAEMSWSDELETIARNYADNCKFVHNPDRSASSSTYDYVGENIYIHTNDHSGTGAVQWWFDEKDYYDYYSNSCQTNKACGHYTQVVWADTNKVGCWVKWCDYITNLFAWSPPEGYLIICNYAPGGNYIGEKPYKTA